MNIEVPTDFNQNDTFVITYRMKLGDNNNFNYIDSVKPNVEIKGSNGATKSKHTLEVPQNPHLTLRQKKIANIGPPNLIKKKQTTTVNSKKGNVGDVEVSLHSSNLKENLIKYTSDQNLLAEQQTEATNENAEESKLSIMGKDDFIRLDSARGKLVSSKINEVMESNNIQVALIDDVNILNRLNALYTDTSTIKRLIDNGELPDIDTSLDVTQSVISTSLHETYELMRISEIRTKEVINEDRLDSLGNRRSIKGESSSSKNNTMRDLIPRLKEHMYKDDDEPVYVASSLFYMCKEFLRIPIVLLILATELYDFSGLKQKVTDRKIKTMGFINLKDVDYIESLRDTLIKHVYLKTNPIFENAVKDKGDIQSEYDFIISKYGRIRIDQISYYLFKIIKDNPNEVNALYSIKYLCQRITLIMLYWTFHTPGSVTTKSRIGYFVDKMSAELYNYHNYNNKVVTFLKIRKDGNNYNRRYNVIEKDTERTILELHYNDTPLPILDSDSKGNEKYNNHFKFGPFTYIFNSGETNPSILVSKQFQEQIITPLINGRPVCIIGYGSSGAGKTSVLIKFQPPGKPSVQGILMLTSNHLATLENSKFTNCSVTIYELKDDENTPTKINKQFIVDDERDTFGKARKVWKNSSSSSIIKMEDWIMDFMDKKRATFPTPNNPVSSRSHVLIEIIYNSSAKLIVCDFAGVENKFDCNNSDVFNKFATDTTFYTSNTSQLLSYQQNQVNTNFNILLNEAINDVSDERVKRFMQPLLNDSEGYDSKIAERVLSSYAFGQKLVSLNFTISMFVEFVNNVNKCLEIVKRHKNTSIIIDDGENDTIYPAIFEMVNDPNSRVSKKSQVSTQMFFYPQKKYSINVEGSEKFNKYLKKTNTISLYSSSEVTGSYEILTTKLEDSPFITQMENKRWNIAKASSFIGFGRSGTQLRDTKTAFDHPVFIDADSVYKKAIKYDFVKEIVNLIDYLNNYPTLLSLFGVNVGDTDVNKLNNMVKFLVNIVNANNSFPFNFNNDNGLNWLIKTLLRNTVTAPPPQQPTDSSKATMKTEVSPNSKLNQKACNSRVKEGEFINASLKKLREYIRDIVMSSQQNLLYPPFVGECVEYQCNPTFKECFGVDQYAEFTSKIIKQQINANNSQLITKMNELLNGKDPLFCVFCVLNVSAVTDRTKEPPPVPYINNVTPLESILQTLQNAAFDEVHYVKDAITKRLLSELTLLVKNIETQLTFDKTITVEVNKIYKNISDQLGNIDYVITELKKVIELISISNAATPIGTLQFTELFSKLFSPTNTCNIIDANANTGGYGANYRKQKNTKTIRKKRYIQKINSKTQYTNRVIDE
jgi:hypothetical protein